MSDGVFPDDAKRDETIVRIEERQKMIAEDMLEIKQKLDEVLQRIECKVDQLEKDVTHTKVWVGIFSSVFIPVVVYLLQKNLR